MKQRKWGIHAKKIPDKLVAFLIGLALLGIFVVVGVKMVGSQEGEGQSGSEGGNLPTVDKKEEVSSAMNGQDVSAEGESSTNDTGSETEQSGENDADAGMDTAETLSEVIEILSKADWKTEAAKESTISLMDEEYRILMQLKYAADECIGCMGEGELTEDFAFVIKDYFGGDSNNFKNIKLLNYAAAAYRFEMAEQEISLVTIGELAEYWEALCTQELGDNRTLKSEFESLMYYNVTYSGVEYVDGMVNLYVRRNDSYENGKLTPNETSKIERKLLDLERGKLLSRDSGKVTCTIESVRQIDQYIVVYGWSNYYNIPYAMCFRNGNDLIGRNLECIYYYTEQAAEYDVIK